MATEAAATESVDTVQATVETHSVREAGKTLGLPAIAGPPDCNPSIVMQTCDACKEWYQQ